MTGDRRGDAAEEARSIVLRAMGDVAGHTIKSQLRQAARHLGYSGDAWRLREALYRRAGSWCSAALHDLRQRYSAWRSREQAGAAAEGLPGLAERVSAVRRLVGELEREVEALEEEVGRLTSTGTPTP